MQPEITEIGIIIVAAALLALALIKIKQPLILSYIIAGFIVGPHATGWVSSPEVIARLSEITIIFLLFVVGMEINVKLIRAVGLVVSIGSFLQVTSITIAGTLLSKVWFDWTTSLYIGFTFSLASTMLVIKTLSDRKQLEHLAGRIIVGILVVQDILTILGLSILTAPEFSMRGMSTMVLVSCSLVMFSVMLGQYIFPYIFREASQDSAVLMLVALGIGFLLVFVFQYFGMSPAIGAIVTGVSFAHSTFSLELLARFRTLRDFFMPLFFASLGMQITMPGTNMIIPIIVLTAAAVTVKPLLTSIVVSLFGYERRTAFITGGSLIPLSEFGPVIIGMGMTLGYFDHEIMTSMLIVMVSSMVVYSYVDFNNLYPKMGPILAFLDKVRFHKGETVEEKMDTTETGTSKDEDDGCQIIIIGADRIGGEIIDLLHPDFPIKVYEVNPDTIRRLNIAGIPCQYADALNDGVWQATPNLDSKIVICTISSSPRMNDLLVTYFRNQHPNVFLILTTNDCDELEKLYAKGAGFIIYPDQYARVALADDVLKKLVSKEAIDELRKAQLEEIKARPKKWEKNRENGNILASPL